MISGAQCCACGCKGWHTLQELFAILVWDFFGCAHALSPARRHDNSELGTHELFRAQHLMPNLAVVFLSGDWEWNVQAFRFRGFSHQHMCWRCEATQSTGALPFTDTSDEAAWRGTRLVGPTAELWHKVKAEHDEPSKLTLLPGFHHELIAIDVLHTWCLGVTQVIVGSFLVEWCGELGVQSLAAAVLQLNPRLRAFSARERRSSKNFSSVDAITVKMLKPDGGFPGQLVGVKGAESRGLARFACELSLESLSTATPESFAYRNLRHMCVASLCDFYKSLRDPFRAEAC